jgi:hypothetical protein
MHGIGEAINALIVTMIILAVISVISTGAWIIYFLSKLF